MPTIEPMEARSVDALPSGEQWRFEPKWDGFRCILVRHGDTAALRSKSGEDLTRYFSELVEAALKIKSQTFVLDGEIVVPDGNTFSFDALLQRIHPAASRVARLAEETPALFIAFDLLAAGPADLTGRRLAERRVELERFARLFKTNDSFRLSSITADRSKAMHWLKMAGGGFDGVIAKRFDVPYGPGTRDAMQKIKRYRSADCVIGGFRYAENKLNGRSVVGSLLLGLYDDDGLLHHVGFTSAIKTAEKARLTDKLTAYIAEKSFTGRAPGGPSRWSTRRSAEWTPLKPRFVVEVSYDHFTGGRFRHGTRILRWRPDKKAQQCTLDQLRQKIVSPASLLS
ncbi:ATP-dependent DNA ligase [Bradyrhizobium sp. LHD-71]|uniref:ATP-dependent DNA ligase n=1 Tax=Bradyrhizobium sp. LHD-71 TaxID=3072141 RepID=UPI0028104A6A|nr:ATP-dependent DNA ligase [Bradyrhizobium sp. LHD-71]MDQ8729308.1 ATP-dependent DNA ligase [Bradyrhizobium sp. LHD-71]